MSPSLLRSRAVAATVFAAIVGLTAGLATIPMAAQADTPATPDQCLALLPANIMQVTDSDVLATFECAGRLDASVYTTSSWATFADDHWAAAVTAHADLGFVASAGLLMQLGLHALEPRGDPTGLARLVAALPSDPTGYPPQAWATYIDHLTVALALAGDPSDATQTQLDQAAGRLAAAAQGLGLTVPPPTAGDSPAGGSAPTGAAGAAGQSPDPGPTVTVTAVATVPGPTVTVQPLPQSQGDQPRVTGARIKAAQTAVVLRRGDTLVIPAAAYTAAGARAKVDFASAKKSIATVSATGRITARAVGKTRIAVTSSGADAVTIAVTVVARSARAVAVAKTSASGVPRTMAAGQAAYATGTYAPARAVKAKVTYASSNKAVATVDKTGRILAKAPGKTTIAIKAGAKTKRVALTVRPTTPSQ
ncbi:MAG: Ig-like domain-containing protein [Bifidobacteriaceae bacterium]|jgi:hypothetical protein|nr:Ig-like domain-containing protein [Bifidobacteriaceae bacterium]